MDIGFRVFFLEEDGSLRNVPWQTYVGLYFGFPSVRFPEYSGKAVKCVHVVVELEERVPIAILESVFFVTHFNAEGGIDQEKKVRRQRVAGDLKDSVYRAPRAGNVTVEGRASLPSGKRRAVAGRAGMGSSRSVAGEGKRIIDLVPRLSERRHDKEFHWLLTPEETEDLERRVQEILNI
jgi:hypothetical protein